jgi:hypothetical protein
MQHEGYSVKPNYRLHIASKRPYVAPGAAIRGEERSWPIPYELVSAIVLNLAVLLHG